MNHREKVGLTLTNPQALVLFELLARMDASGTLDLEDHAEQLVLWKLEGQLEAALEEILLTDYRQRIYNAREEVKGSEA